MAAAVSAPMQLAADMSAMEQPREARFYPYDYNGGYAPPPPTVRADRLCPRPPPHPETSVRPLWHCRTVLAVAGKNFSIVAGDTRMSTGFSIKSRNVSKVYEM